MVRSNKGVIFIGHLKCTTEIKIGLKFKERNFKSHLRLIIRHLGKLGSGLYRKRICKLL